MALYYFHLVDASPEPLSWLSLTRYDPWQHGTYRPLSHLILYLEYKVFGVHFIWNHLVNFSMYCLNIVLLYLIALRFRLDRFLTGTFLLVYAFLYSHFDIVTWTFQFFTTMSFPAFMLGFLLYLSFLESGRESLLVATGALFLFSMYCFELYALWPPALLLLAWGRRYLLAPNRPWPKKNPIRPTVFLLSAVYLLYLVVFLLTRMAEDTTGELPRLNPVLALQGVGTVFFNLLYNGILVNLVPSVTEPLTIYDNLDMGGLLADWRDVLPVILPWIAGGGIILLVLAGIKLYRRGKKRALLILSFLIFLYSTYYFILSVSRISTNTCLYPLTQFRYQYIANALLVLMVVTVLSELIRLRRLGKIVTACLLLPVLATNILYSHKYITRIGSDLEPLGRLLNNIRSGLESGEINPRARLFIKEEVVRFLPPLCWNEAMGRFQEGTYQWFFSTDQQNCFTLSRMDAAWLLGEDDNWTIYSAHPARQIQLNE